jgi:hypothetical protein
MSQRVLLFLSFIPREDEERLFHCHRVLDAHLGDCLNDVHMFRLLKMSAQTEQLRLNLQTQFDRLLDQLADLDETKNEMDDDEYREARQDTIEQLEDFSKSLEKMKNGDANGLSLLNDLQRMQNVSETHPFRSTRRFVILRRFNVPLAKHFKRLT